MGPFDIQADIERFGGLLDKALAECKVRGIACAEAEAHYYTVKAQAVFAMKAAGMAATTIALVVKGDPTVNEALVAFRKAEVEYDNAKDARNIYKRRFDFSREQYQREWNEAGMAR